jgi:hypothetical protein
MANVPCAPPKWEATLRALIPYPLAMGRTAISIHGVRESPHAVLIAITKAGRDLSARNDGREGVDGLKQRRGKRKCCEP